VTTPTIRSSPQAKHPPRPPDYFVAPVLSPVGLSFPQSFTQAHAHVFVRRYLSCCVFRVTSENQLKCVRRQTPLVNT